MVVKKGYVMKILLVDDEQFVLEEMKELVEKVVPDAEIAAFSWPSEAEAYFESNEVDVAFLDIEMGVENGIQLAKKLKQRHPNVNLIFVTGYSQYATAAFQLRSSGYILKPPTKEAIEEELKNLRHPIGDNNTEVFYIQCFGNFEVFNNGEPIRFERRKTKELLAYLVDRKGAMVSMGEISGALFENDENETSNRSYCRSLMADLKKTLQKCGREEVLIHGFQNSYGINTEKVVCDYYNYLKGLPEGIRTYNGEYMSQYSWGEVTLASLIENE